MSRLGLTILHHLLRALATLALAMIGYISYSQNDVMHFDHLTIKEGLSHNTILSMTQDRNGYIWIGTQMGLNKYDGNLIQTYSSDESISSQDGFKGRGILCIYEDSDGNIWAGTRNHGINFKSKNSDIFINLENNPIFEKIRGVPISSFNEDNKKNLWITTIGQGILKYNIETEAYQHYTSKDNGLYNDLVFSIAFDKQDNAWVATAGTGIDILEKGDVFRHIDVDIQNDAGMDGFRKKLLQHKDYIYIGTEGSGFYRVQTDTKKFTHYTEGKSELVINSNRVLDMHASEDGKILIATDGAGMYILNPETNDLKSIQRIPNNPTSLNSNALYSIMEDEQKNIWVGTFNGGVNIYKKNKIWFDQISSLTIPTNEKSILAIHETHYGSILVGLDDGDGLDVIEGNEIAFQYLKEVPNLEGSIVKSIHEDKQGNIWIGKYERGVMQLNADLTETALSKKLKLTTQNIWSIVESSEGIIYLATLGNGIFVIRDNKIINHLKASPTVANSIRSNNIMKLMVDAEGLLWIGHADIGIDIYNPKSETIEHLEYQKGDNQSLSSNDIRAIFQDNDGNIWVGTESGGLNRYKGNGKFEHITKKDGLISNNVMGIIADDQNYLWVSTFSGISRIKTEDFSVDNFDFHNSSRTNQFNQDAILKSKNGILYFGGINGLHAIDPRKVSYTEPLSKLNFTNLTVSNRKVLADGTKNKNIIISQPIEIAEQVNLTYQDRNFKIEFSSFDYTNTKEKSYSYMLEGFNEEFISLDKGINSVSFTNLDPKLYTLFIKEGGNKASIKIKISPPFYMTGWFRILAILLTLFTIFFSLNFIFERREEANKQSLLEAERQILKLENEKLEFDVNTSNSKLLSAAAQMAHKNEILNGIKDELAAQQKNENPNFRRVIRQLDRELKNTDYWNEFNLYFDKVDKNFIKEIVNKHPDLTQNDIRVCALMRLNLSTKEIASLLNISVRGVEKGRYRLKKRLGLSNEDDLLKYIRSFSN